MLPEALMTGSVTDKLEGWTDKKITADRIDRLLNRGSALAINAERWSRTGLWVMTRMDSDYPRRLKRRLGSSSPAFLYGAGNRALLNQGGFAVVGSRNASSDALAYATGLAEKAASGGYGVVSGGARGIDETAMLGALNVEGTAVGVLSDGLAKAASSSKYRKHLLSGNLALVSAVGPEAVFHPGNAMQRNKYIYCTADSAIVVASGTKGGTWSGAVETLKKKWVPLWVRKIPDAESGNSALIRLGGSELTSELESLGVDDLFRIECSEEPAAQESFSVREEAVLDAVEVTNEAPASSDESDSATDALVTPEIPESFYHYFLLRLKESCSDQPKTVDNLVEELEVNKTQLNVWLKTAVSEGVLSKKNKPVRYEWVTKKQATMDFLNNE